HCLAPPAGRQLHRCGVHRWRGPPARGPCCRHRPRHPLQLRRSGPIPIGPGRHVEFDKALDLCATPADREMSAPIGMRRFEMITAEQNQRLTQTGAGTPMGELLRRYWWPIAATVDLDTEPVQPIRLLGEDLTLFRSERGEIGLLGDRCAHRAISLAYGVP